jgi:citrate lyase synthetase
MQAVVVIGRFNPPTKGHAVVFRQAAEIAKKHQADLFVFVSRTEDNVSNPLSIASKIAYLESFFPGIQFKPMKNAYDAIKNLSNEGYSSVILLAGSDRAPGYNNMISRGMAKSASDPEKINLESFEVFQIDRDPDADDTSGASATKMREAAKANNWEAFKNMAPDGNDKLKKMMFNSVKAGLN